MLREYGECSVCEQPRWVVGRSLPGEGISVEICRHCLTKMLVDLGWRVLVWGLEPTRGHSSGGLLRVNNQRLTPEPATTWIEDPELTAEEQEAVRLAEVGPLLSWDTGELI